MHSPSQILNIIIVIRIITFTIIIWMHSFILPIFDNKIFALRITIRLSLRISEKSSANNYASKSSWFSSPSFFSNHNSNMHLPWWKNGLTTWVLISKKNKPHFYHLYEWIIFRILLCYFNKHMRSSWLSRKISVVQHTTQQS